MPHGDVSDYQRTPVVTSYTPSAGAMDVKPAIARNPFDNADRDSDLILRTSDNVDFYVHKLFLKKASSVFADMLTVGQDGSSTISTDNLPSYLPVVTVIEAAEVIDSLLRMCYPVIETKPDSLTMVTDLLRTALKYDMTKPISSLKVILLSYIEDLPMAVYATACTLNLEHEASAAATAYKRRLQQKYGYYAHKSYCRFQQAACSYAVADGIYKDMQQSTAGHLYRLLRYISGNTASFCTPTVQIQTPHDEGSIINENHSFTTLPDSDIIVRSVDGVDLSTHKLVLHFASADAILNRLPDGVAVDGRPIIRLEEDGRTLATLLQFCYPSRYEEKREETVSLIATVGRTAEKYGMVKVAQATKLLIIDYINHSPLDVFFAAARNGWAQEAELATTQCSSLSLDVYGPNIYTEDMEFVSAEDYFQLLKRCREGEGRSAIGTLKGDQSKR